ncbi:DEAD/DEAH box helicase [Thalassospira sp.]|uniref:DEAD/DEAH box helicase n=1 Tax=Thalassospira sp. TaxID=1912094 RepID=UPI000C53311D|nr:DEAD/DEAH box helicase [Thalassospira sp.]MAL41865.1 hypothetical protein [Thalassospira sp.]|tara:strand:+ start:224 stop:2710 length:2487 start_codon:yes stop_codon:yes gene_type:complete
MALNFSKLKNNPSTQKQIDPRKIFSTLNRDTSKFKRPSDEQGDVLDQWFEKRNRSDITIKMNTGSGKTVVGLLCLQSSLNEIGGTAVYIAPDKYLVAQVLEEAKLLGIKVTEDESDASFLAGQSILVINIWKLVNGRSVFGVGSEGVKIDISSIVVDDAHACLATVADQFKIKIDRDHKLYEFLLRKFKSCIETQSENGYLDLKEGDKAATVPIPSWNWIDQLEDVRKELHKFRNDDVLKWPWRLLEGVLPQCRIVFGGGHLEIAPKFIPMDNIPAFTSASRKIYMTATLADDTILVTHFQANDGDVREPVRPKGGGDIGDRMIIAPQEVNPLITTDEIKAAVKKYSKSINVSVIVPSNSRAGYWKSIADQILTADNIEDGTEKLRKGHVGLTVFVGKYDGVDLPAKSCEMLVIDSLPEVSGLIEKIEQTWLAGPKGDLNRQIQRIEQGMGRGVRSSQDHCVVLLMGARLTQRLRKPEAARIFSTATRAQVNLGREVTSQLEGAPLDEICEVFDLCLNEDAEWLDTSRNAVVNAEEDNGARINDAVVSLRKAFDAARLKQNDTSVAFAQEAVDLERDTRRQGYMLQQLAEYMHSVDQLQAQEIQIKALSKNRSLMKPVAGISPRKLEAPRDGQGATAVTYMQRFLEKNELIGWVNALLDELIWDEEKSKAFESAWNDLGKFLGFSADRPEETYGRGPDNFWALGDNKYLVIECKSGATEAQKISKHDCNQLAGSLNWFHQLYGMEALVTPIMIHQKLVPEFAATLPNETRMIDEQRLGQLKAEVQKYAIAIGKGLAYTDAAKVEVQLKHFKLHRNMFVQAFTTSPRLK